jgi:hypothetical protein
MAVTSLYYELFHKYRMLGACHARLTELQTIRTQLADTNSKVDASDAALAIAESRLGRDRP